MQLWLRKGWFLPHVLGHRGSCSYPSRPLTAGVFLGILWQEEDLGLLDPRGFRAKAARCRSPSPPAAICSPQMLPAPGAGTQDFPKRSGRRGDSLAVCDGVHVIGTDLEEVDHMQAPGDLVGQVDQHIAVLGQCALPVLRRALPVKPLWGWGRGDKADRPPGFYKFRKQTALNNYFCPEKEWVWPKGAAWRP